MSSETWKKAPGFSDYRVSDLGNVAAMDYEKKEATPLSPQPDESGRRYIVLVDDTGRRRNVSVGTLVLLAHVGRPRGKASRVIHGKKGLGCDALTNLRWGTRAEQWEANRKYLVNFPGARDTEVTEAMARRIRERIAAGKTTLRAAARKEGVARTTLTNAIKRLPADRNGHAPKRRKPAAA